MEELLRESQSLPELQVDAKFQKALETLQNSQDITTSASGRISTIVKSLKDFARLDESARQVADLNSALTTTLALLRHELHERITVVRHLGKLPPVHCYLSQVNQVLMNLLLNASQAIEGQGRITVSTRHQGDTVSISIADTGTGIPADNLTRIFDPGGSRRKEWESERGSGYRRVTASSKTMVERSRCRALPAKALFLRSGYRFAHRTSHLMTSWP